MSRKLPCILLLLIFSIFSVTSFAQNSTRVRGIYLTQSTLENTESLKYLIQRAKATGVNTFVIDYDKANNKYTKNIPLVKNSNIRYVVRITVFPDGANREQMASQAYRDKKLALIKQAVALGAQEVQLDYIRYNTKQPPLDENAKNVQQVIKWYRTKVAALGVPLQVDVFGITSFHEEKRIGQNVVLIGNVADVLCPMVYPSHYEPFRQHAVTPYETVRSSLEALQSKFPANRPFKLYPYIELSNYRYPLSNQQRLKYIHAQIKATEDGKADGWYAWSPHNRYDNLFAVLEKYPVK
jgi:hypothetical protein